MASSTVVARKTVLCEWFVRPSRTRCSKCGEPSVCSKACMKAFWPEHKLVCRARRQVAAVDALADELAGLHVDQRSLWLVIPEEQQDSLWSAWM